MNCSYPKEKLAFRKKGCYSFGHEHFYPKTAKTKNRSGAVVFCWIKFIIQNIQKISKNNDGAKRRFFLCVKRR